MRTDIAAREPDIRQWITQGRSKAWICQQLDCRPVTFENWLRKLGIEYKGVASGFGHVATNKRPSNLYLVFGSLIPSHRLKLKLLQEQIKSQRCESCGITEWLGNPVPLELHHVDGDRRNNRLENLQLLCPNCHAMTSNNAGKGVRQRNTC